MKIGILYFSALSEIALDVVGLLRQIRLIEETGLDFVSFPERHFDRFGGFYANPLIYCAIAASHTKRISIRTGSLIPALHNQIRLKEDIRLVDNISSGRIQLCFGSGWNPNDFSINRELFSERKLWLTKFIENFDRWYSETICTERNGNNMAVELEVFPRKYSNKIPLWLTISASLPAWEYAGKRGLNVLSHMENVDHESLRIRIEAYRDGRKSSGLNPGSGIVTLMQHTAITESEHGVIAANEALYEYISDALKLELRAVESQSPMSGNKIMPVDQLANSEVREDIARRATNRYGNKSSLISDYATAVTRIQSLKEIGVDEIACLIDFIHDIQIQNETIRNLGTIRKSMSEDSDNIMDYVNTFCS